MCQLAYASNLKKLDPKKLDLLFKTIQKRMSQSNRSGYGIAAKQLSGQIDISKSLDVTNPVHTNSIGPVFCKPDSINNIDLESKRYKEVIFHARTSTNSVSLNHCHPYVIGDTVLSHNGVLSYTGETYDKKTDNDTEDLTYHFDKYGLENIDRVFTGYAAFIAFKKGQTHIIKDSRASLNYFYSSSLDCHFFATTRDTLLDIQKVLKLKNLKIYEVIDNTEIIIKNNLVSALSQWPGLQSSSYADSKSYLSLGYQQETSKINKNSWLYSGDDLLSDDQISESYFFDNNESLEIDLYGHKLTYQEYLKLDEISKLECRIIDKNKGA